MALFSKPNALVYVLRSGLIVAGRHITQARLNFSPDIVTNLEVVNKTKLVDQCQQFFADAGFRRKRAQVILDNGVVFRKNIELDRKGQPGALTDAFITAMPFNEGQRACLNIQADKLLQLLATNADLYKAIVEALDACGASKVIAVTPVAAYDLSGTDKKLSNLIDRFLKGGDAAKQANFLSVESY